MVYFKELRNKDLTYLAIVDREQDDGNSGTRFVTRPSLRSSKGEASVVNKNCFHPEMSSKFDIAKLDVTARFLLKSTFKTKADEHSTYPLLGRRIIAGSVKWGSNNLKIYGESKHIAGYWEWTEEVLARFGDILEASSINSAINASLYSYDKHVPVMRAFFEGWCSTTNTLHTREGELSISLWDLKMLGGLPIVGEIYDETVPHPSLLKGENIRDETSVPATCKYLFAAYHRLARKSTIPGKVSAKQWIEFWFKRGETYQPPVKRSKTKLRPRSTQNPSGRFDPRPSDDWTEEEQAIFEKLGLTNNAHRAKLYLAAYISCWLCTFVLPENEDRWIRAGTFEMACLMAEGRRFCLAAPVLASIYRGLNDLVKSSNPGYSKSFFPAHYLYGWLAYYFNTHHDVKPEPRGPSMVKYSGAVSALSINDEDARALIHDGGKAKVHCFIPHKNKADILFDNGDLKSSKLSYLVVERFASERQRPESLERDIAMHQNEADHNKSLLDKAMEEYQVQVTEHSAVQSKITDLETELSKALELESKLSKSLEAKGISLTALETNFENAIKSLKELENTPTMSADEEDLLREQWARLEEMRMSLTVDP